MTKINQATKIVLMMVLLFFWEGGGIGSKANDYCSPGNFLPVEEKFPSFAIARIRPDKVFTPNGDGWNDYLEIEYKNPYDAMVKGKVYDLKGRLVANMENDESNERLVWNGWDIDGNPATGGIYIYQIEVSGPESKVIKGTIILVK